jgi:hypothetical protein
VWISFSVRGATYFIAAPEGGIRFRFQPPPALPGANRDIEPLTPHHHFIPKIVEGYLELLQMATKKKKIGEMLHLMTSLTASYEATLPYYSKRDKFMKRNFPGIFTHWRHAPEHAFLISPETRRAIRLEPSKFVIRAERLTRLGPFEKLIPIVKSALRDFDVQNLVAANFTSTRVLKMESLIRAREVFAQKFFSAHAQTLMEKDEATEFGLIVERKWPTTKVFCPAKDQPEKTALIIGERTDLTPMTSGGILKEGGRWAEFRQDASSSPAYLTEFIAPDYSILSEMKFDMISPGPIGSVKMDTLWKFYEWARKKSDQVRSKIEE